MAIAALQLASAALAVATVRQHARQPPAPLAAPLAVAESAPRRAAAMRAVGVAAAARERRRRRPSVPAQPSGSGSGGGGNNSDNAVVVVVVEARQLGEEADTARPASEDAHVGSACTTADEDMGAPEHDDVGWRMCGGNRKRDDTSVAIGMCKTQHR
eukprot:351251-Chlamydomonas_euryale.AAC.7